MNNLKIFNFEISDIKIGLEKVKAVMLDGRKHWPSVDEKQYFTIKATSDSIIKFSKVGLNYSLDDGKTWTPLNANVAVPLAKGKKMMFQGTPTASTSDPYGIGSFSASTGTFEAEGNIMSLTYGTDFIGKTSLAGRGNFALSCIFKDCKSLVSAKNLLLPATTLTQQCYYATFYGCTNMVEGPTILPAETLSTLCYQQMFQGCTSLKKSPILPAEKLVSQCYHYMFYGCTSLNDITCYATNSTNSTAYTDNWVTNVAPTGVFHKNEEKRTNWARSVHNIPPTWAVDGVKDYFKIVAEEECNIKVDRGEHYGSKDGGITWFPMGTSAWTLSPSEELLITSYLTPSSSAPYGVGGFSGSTGGKFHAEGNIMSLRYGDNYSVEKDSEFPATDYGSYLFCRMFHGTKVTSVENLVLPNSVAAYMFDNTFYNCTELIKAPKILPAETLADYCYNGMFNGCTKLEKSPILPAKTLKTAAYIYMFQNCTSLNEIWCYATDINASSGLTNWVNNVAPTGVFHRDGGNTQWTINSINGVPIGWELDPPLGYFTLVAKEPSVVKFSKNGLSGSTDGGATWFTMNTAAVPLDTGQELMLKSNITPSTGSPYGIGSFAESTGNFSAKGNIQSLNYPDTLSGPVKTRAFSWLFKGCTAITDVEEVIFPSTVAPNCYDYMFREASNLEKAPKILPATVLANGCYDSMFMGTKITKSPILPAESIGVQQCYYQMFSGCTNLKEITCYATTGVDTNSSTSNWVAGVSPTGVFHKNMEKKTTWASRGNNGIPTSWKVAELDEYLTFKAIEASTIKYNKTLNYSLDGGDSWALLAANAAVELEPGKTVMFESYASPKTDGEPYGIGSFSASTGNFEVYGNPLSITYGDNYNLQTTMRGEYQFAALFKDCKGLTSIKNMIFPDFLIRQCYRATFGGCTNLVEIPDVLPATTMVELGYNHIFSGCTSLAEVSEDLLPAMTLANECYNGMFQGCTSLEKAPKLPAETMATSCYINMFSGCTSLNEIWCYATGNTTAHTSGWVTSVAPTGTFHKNTEKDTNWAINNVNGIPIGWTPDPIPNYFTVVAVEDSNIKMNRGGFSGSTDGGYTWFAMNTSGTPLAAGEELMMVCANGPNTGSTPYGVGGFSNSTGNFAVKGNIMSLRYGFNFERKYSLDESCFRTMFQNCTAITDAYDLEMPASAFTGGNQHCRMFEGCTNLKRGPKILPSTAESGSYLYEYMFKGCTSLEESPIIMLKSAVNSGTLHATFSGCTSLSAITCYATNVSTAQCVDFSQGVAPKGVFTKEEKVKTNWVRGKEGIPTTWCAKDVKGYFELEAITDCVFKNSRSPYYYSVDSGETWALLPTSGVEISAGDSMLVNAQIVGGTSAPYGIGSWSGSTGTYNAKGNALSLSKGDNFELDTNLVRTFELSSIFIHCTGLISAKDLKLPSMSLYKQCYYAMFWDCPNLIEAPELPALTLSELCYQEMFIDCTSLVKAPELPAETPASQCYYRMFSGCTSLNEVTCMLTGNTTAHTENWVYGVAEYGTFHKNEELPTNWTRGTSGIPTKWGLPETKNYFAIKAIEPSVVKFSWRDNTFYYSIDEGESWLPYDTANKAIELAAGKRVLWQTQYGGGTGTVYSFSATTGNIEAEGNIMSFVYGDNFEHQTVHKTGAYRYMFADCTALTSCENIVFTDVAMGNRTCDCMFTGCTNLEKVPSVLPAMSLNEFSYCKMFYGCSKLKKAPKLPATSLANRAYYQMFSGCTSLDEIWCSYTGSDTSFTENWVANVAPTGIFHKNLEEKTAWSRGNNGIPYTWEVDGLDDYFTIEAIEASQIRSSKGNWQYSIDGQPWSAMAAGAMIPLAAGEKMRIRSNSNIAGATSDARGNGCFSGSTGTFKASGNIKSLCLADNYDLQPVLYQDSFTNLFKGCTAITSVEDVKFPTTLVHDDFPWAFSGCTRLTKVAVLPAESATSNSHYWEMFLGCTALTEVPENMLPSLTVGQAAYRSMFQGCTSLVKAPKLPATGLTTDSYIYMFSGCTSLNEIWCSYTGSNSSYMSNWVANVSPTGVFHKDMENLTTWSRGVNGIPATWAVADVENYFTIEAIEPSVIKHTSDWYRSLDGGVTWEYIAANVGTSLQPGEKVMYNANKTPVTGSPYTGIGSFSASTGVYKAYGNPKSLMYSDNFSDKTPNKYRSYQKLFLKCTGLTDASGIILPEYLEADTAYAEMFEGCTSLTKIPEYVGKDSRTEGRYAMFSGCTSLEYGPKLPAETIVGTDYYRMFYDCTSLKEIWCSATTLGNNENWVYNVSPTGVFHKNMDVKTNWSRATNGIPSGWSVADNDNYFRLEANEASSIKFSKGGLYYSVDNGETWAVYTANTAVELAAGKEILFNGIKTPDTSEPRGIGNFAASTGSFKVKGDAMSLLYGDNYDFQTTSKQYAYQGLFSGCTSVTDASGLILTATTLAATDFYAMFSGCTNLVLPPKELPALTASTYGYGNMFNGCTSLTEAPHIAAKTLSGSFNFTHMFAGCTSLTKVQDELYPTSIPANAYDSMFLDCSSLEKAPYLPATVINANNCYGWMFQRCTNLKYIKCGAVTLGGTANWVDGVGSEGTFYRAPAASWSTGANGAPNGWTVKLMSEE